MFIVNLQKGLQSTCAYYKLSHRYLQLYRMIIKCPKWVYFGCQLSNGALTVLFCHHIHFTMFQRHWMTCEPFAQTATSLCLDQWVQNYILRRRNNLSSSFSFQLYSQLDKSLYSMCPADFSNWPVKIINIYSKYGTSYKFLLKCQNIYLNF